MRVLERTIRYRGRGAEYRIHAVADIHLGSRACDEARLDRTLDEIDKDPSALWILLGDQCDFIAQRDPRYDLSSLPRWLYDAAYDNPKVGLAALQRDELARRINKRKSLGRKLLAVVEGNHEAMIRKYSEVDSYMGLVEQIRADKEQQLAIGASGFLVLRFTRTAGSADDPTIGNTHTLRIYMTHGWGGGDLAGGTALKLEREMDRYDANIYLMGHVHKVQTHISSRPITLNQNLELVQPPDRMGAICGTYMRGRISGADTYAEVKGYRPSPVSSNVTIRVQPMAGTYTLETRNGGRASVL